MQTHEEQKTYIMKRPDQGHLHPKLEPFEHLVYRYSEHQHMSARPVENARDNINIQSETLVIKETLYFRMGVRVNSTIDQLTLSQDGSAVRG